MIGYLTFRTREDSKCGAMCTAVKQTGNLDMCVGLLLLVSQCDALCVVVSRWLDARLPCYVFVYVRKCLEYLACDGN